MRAWAPRTRTKKKTPNPISRLPNRPRPPKPESLARKGLLSVRVYRGFDASQFTRRLIDSRYSSRSAAGRSFVPLQVTDVADIFIGGGPDPVQSVLVSAASDPDHQPGLQRQSL